jgi:hypothetical protein
MLRQILHEITLESPKIGSLASKFHNFGPPNSTFTHQDLLEECHWIPLVKPIYLLFELFAWLGQRIHLRFVVGVRHDIRNKLCGFRRAFGSRGRIATAELPYDVSDANQHIF